MDLCLGFDDSDFKGKQKKEQKLFTSYNAKICYPKWFQDVEDLDGQIESKATILKFKADYLYRQEQYTEAIPHYEEGIAALPTSHRIMKRELQESLSRCYIQVGNYTAAMNITAELMQGSTTSSQVCHVLQIKQQVYRSSRKIPDEILVLQRLVSMHPYNGHFWLSLGSAYGKLQHLCQMEGSKPDCDSKTDVSDAVIDKVADEFTRQSLEACKDREAIENVTVGDAGLMSLTCYVRSKLLFRSVKGMVASFIKARNEEVLKQIEAYIQEITEDEGIIRAATEHMRQDLYQEETEDGDDKTTDTETQVATPANVTEFDDRWFSWTRNMPQSAH